MALDAPYRQLMQLLCSRGFDWFRRRIEALPASTSTDAINMDLADLGALAQVARFAPVYAGLRGTITPLDAFVKLRLTPDLVASCIALVKQGQRDPALVQMLIAAQGLGIGNGRQISDLHRTLAGLANCETLDLPTRLALSGRSNPALLDHAEKLLCYPLAEPMMEDARIDRFTRILMQLYGYGALRPQLSSARSYGEIFLNCLRIADWAENHRRLTPLAQMAFALCLIDPEHDVQPLLGEIIASQRPDGSFPIKLGFGTQDQELADAATPTVMTLTALHMAIHRRWQQPPHDRLAA